MCGWMDGQTDGWTDRWMGGRVDEWMIDGFPFFHYDLI